MTVFKKVLYGIGWTIGLIQDIIKSRIAKIILSVSGLYCCWLAFAFLPYLIDAIDMAIWDEPGMIAVFLYKLTPTVVVLMAWLLIFKSGKTLIDVFIETLVKEEKKMDKKGVKNG